MVIYERDYPEKYRRILIMLKLWFRIINVLATTHGIVHAGLSCLRAFGAHRKD
jgi:hypothetical protein